MPVRYNNAKFVALGEALAAADGWQLKVGCVGPGAAAHEEGSNLTLAALWFIHEYGTADGRIRERAPLRKTMIARRDEILTLMRKIMAGIYSGKVTAEQALALVGLRVASWIKLTITTGLEPDNADSTIARKKSSKPLIDDGQLVNSVSYVVEHASGAAAAVAAVAVPAEAAA